MIDYYYRLLTMVVSRSLIVLFIFLLAFSDAALSPQLVHKLRQWRELSYKLENSDSPVAVPLELKWNTFAPMTPFPSLFPPMTWAPWVSQTTQKPGPSTATTKFTGSTQPWWTFAPMTWKSIQWQTMGPKYYKAY